MSAPTAVPSSFSNFLAKTVRFDVFGKDFAMSIEKDEQSVKSRAGCCATVFLTVVTLLYAY